MVKHAYSTSGANLAVPGEYKAIPSGKLAEWSPTGQVLRLLPVLPLHVLLQLGLAGEHHLALGAGLGAARGVGLRSRGVLVRQHFKL